MTTSQTIGNVGEFDPDLVERLVIAGIEDMVKTAILLCHDKEAAYISIDEDYALRISIEPMHVDNQEVN